MPQSGPLDSFEKTISPLSRFESLPTFLSFYSARRLHSMAFMAFSLTALVGNFTYDAFDDS